MHPKSAVTVGTIKRRIGIATQPLQRSIDDLEPALDLAQILRIGVMKKIRQLHDAAAALAGCGIAIVATQGEQQLASEEVVAEEVEDVLELEARADGKPVARGCSTVPLENEAVLEPLIRAAEAREPFPHRRGGLSHLLGRQDDVFLDEGMIHRADPRRPPRFCTKK